MRSEILIHNEELSKEWIDRMADAGITTIGIHPAGGTAAVKALEKLMAFLADPEYRGLIDYAAERGLEIEYELHAAGYLMPRELFEEHPEYFRVNTNGDRVPDWNFCITNPEALDIVAKRAAKLATSLYRSAPRFYFWMDDSKDSNCHCPECSKLSPSDQQLLVVNAMLKEIKKYIPDAKMAYLAYQQTIPLPETVKPEEGVFLEYAPFEKYTAKGDDAPMLIERELRMTQPLMEFFGKEDVKLLEYWYDNSLFSGWKKPPKKFILDKEGMDKDIAHYKELGFDYIATFGCFLGKDYEELYGDKDVDLTPLVDAVNG